MKKVKVKLRDPKTAHLISCPYNDAHQILPHRFQKHLVKCAKQHPHIKLEVCPFNSSHRIPPESLSAHKVECPNRVSFEKYMTEMDIGPWKKDVKKEIKYPKYEDDENWDVLVGKGGYDPTAAIAFRPVLRVLIGATNAKKRQFYNEERKRLQLIRDLIDSGEYETEVEKLRVKEEEMNDDSNDSKDVNDEEKSCFIKNEPKTEEILIKSEEIKEEPLPEKVINPIHVKNEEIKEEPLPEKVINPIHVKHEKITVINPLNIKKETSETRPDLSCVKQEYVDEVMMLYKKRQEELQNVIRNLQTKEPNADPRLLLEDKNSRTRERSLSPIFPDMQSDPRLRINPLSLMKGKENYRDPRLGSMLKKEREKMRKLLEEEEKQQKEQQKPESMLLGDIDVLDQLIDEVITPVKTRLRSTSTCSNESKESGEITNDSESEVIVIDSEEDLDDILNSAEFKELKQCALRSKSHTSSESGSTRSSSKRRSRRSRSRERSPIARKEPEGFLGEVEKLKRKIKKKRKS